MIITENTNLNGTLQIAGADGVKKSVVSINSNMVQNSNNFNFNLTIMDRASMEGNIEEIQSQMDEFMALLKVKMLEMGYKVTI